MDHACANALVGISLASLNAVEKIDRVSSLSSGSGIGAHPVAKAPALNNCWAHRKESLVLPDPYLDHPNFRRVVVVRALPGLGDFLCAVPALRSLRSALPGA